ncbi:DUF1694 domain-containing protein, partial [Acinetobacter baumannii]|uniref:DUF1694 domain-containing protein n=1 Tax=Acinetobacter baumannii TaxID=470 RepID=UPI001AECD391
YDPFCLEQFSKYIDGTLSINANSPQEIHNHYMKIAQNAGINFKLIDTDLEDFSPNDTTVVFSVDYAVNLDDISVEKFIKEKVTTTTNKEKYEKTNFFEKLFKF